MAKADLDDHLVDVVFALFDDNGNIIFHVVVSLFGDVVDAVWICRGWTTQSQRIYPHFESATNARYGAVEGSGSDEGAECHLEMHKGGNTAISYFIILLCPVLIVLIPTLYIYFRRVLSYSLFLSEYSISSYCECSTQKRFFCRRSNID